MTRINLTTTKSVKLKTQGKYCAEDIQVVPNLETVNVTPTTAEQEFSVGSGFSGIGKVNVDAVNPADYYKPESVAEVTPTTSEQNITPTEGSVFSGVKVKAIQTEQTTIKTNGTHTPSAGKFFDKVVVEVADIPAKLQEKSVTPTREPQTVLPDTNFEGMSKVEVGGIPAEFIVPSGSITATENKTYDVTEVKEVVVAVPEKADAKLIEGSATKNGEYRASDFGADGFDIFTVNVEEKYLEPEGSMLIEENGDYDVKDIAEVQVRVPEKEDLDAELQAQDEALTELEDAVDNLPDAGSGGEGKQKIEIVGSWRTPNDGEYYMFYADGTLSVVTNGKITLTGTYDIYENRIIVVTEGSTTVWYYNKDGGMAVEENGESVVTRMMPEGTLKVIKNGKYDVTSNTMVDIGVFVPEYQNTTAIASDVLSGKKFISKSGDLIEGSIELFEPQEDYTENTVLLTKGKYLTNNISISVVKPSERHPQETLRNMQEIDYMRYLQGEISRESIPSDNEYLEQQEYVESVITNIMMEDL